MNTRGHGRPGMALAALLVLLASPVSSSLADEAGARPPAQTATAAEPPARGARTPPLRATDPAAFEAEVRKIEGEGDTASGGRSMGFQLLQTVVMLGAVVALIYLTLGKLLPRVLNMSEVGRRALLASPPRGLIELVDRVALDPRRAFVVVRVGREHFLVGLAEQNINILAKLDEASLEEARRSTGQAAPAPSVFAGFLGRSMRGAPSDAPRGDAPDPGRDNS